MSTASNLVLSDIRPMQLQDIAGVMEIELVSYDFPWKESIYKDCLKVGYGCWVIEYAQKIVGYGIMTAAAGEAHILNICIREDYRRFGLGRLLLNHLLEISRIQQATTVFLEVRMSNVVAYRLYEEEGFSEVGLRKDYYPAVDGREDALIMAKELFI
ncbi:MAG: ribosomal protein S18-alanine N-acetyltransferase [Gammaproteobacteria bacterium]